MCLQCFTALLQVYMFIGMLHSKSVRQLDQWDLRDLETLGALSSALAALGTLQLRALRFLNHVDPLVSVSNLYLV